MEKNFFKIAFDLGSWNSQAQWPNFGSHFRPSGPLCHSTDRGLHSCSTAPEPFTAAFLHIFQEALLPAFQCRLSSYADSQFSAHCSKSREFLSLSCSAKTATTSWQLKLPSFLPFPCPFPLSTNAERSFLCPDDWNKTIHQAWSPTHCPPNKTEIQTYPLSLKKWVWTGSFLLSSHRCFASSMTSVFPSFAVTSLLWPWGLGHPCLHHSSHMELLDCTCSPSSLKWHPWEL